MDDVLLATARLVLRRLRPDDLDALTALDADPEVMRFIGPPTPRAVLRDEHLPHWLGWYARSDRWGFWAAEDTSGGFLGWFHLRPQRDDPDDEPELGYRLRRDAWGRGLATEGSRALVDLAFGVHGARRVYATTMAVNTASRRVMEKAGLRYVRTFHGDWPDPLPGDEHGDVEYALTRDAWSAGRAGPADLVVEVDDPRRPAVAAVLARHLAFAAEHSPPEHVHALDVDGLAADPAITFLSATADGRVVGVGALRRLDGTHAELKSMHVIAEARGHGVARALLDALLARARAAGFDRVSLETGAMEAFAPAHRLYARAGFTPCPPFAAYTSNPYSRCMTMRLTADPSPA